LERKARFLRRFSGVKMRPNSYFIIEFKHIFSLVKAYFLAESKGGMPVADPAAGEFSRKRNCRRHLTGEQR
jgi:hypothetical protein